MSKSEIIREPEGSPSGQDRRASRTTPNQDTMWEMVFMLHLSQTIEEHLQAEKNGQPLGDPYTNPPGRQAI